MDKIILQQYLPRFWKQRNMVKSNGTEQTKAWFGLKVKPTGMDVVGDAYLLSEVAMSTLCQSLLIKAQRFRSAISLIY